ncbi:hypothetical protein BDV96DRAFT_602085 [Lophiotrema nucula]|uniref:Uncharacterized protein n=1 Tax=Lophiotrema nucula TaxID=690887 RepID=A0A6A5Z2S5_9PLEO|nr:hypothetical protein BDV96DRAFT_602085 [Lophiotrema nucula]
MSKTLHSSRQVGIVDEHCSATPASSIRRSSSQEHLPQRATSTNSPVMSLQSKKNPSTISSTTKPLTAKALAQHNTNMSIHEDTAEALEKLRVLRLKKAARDLGFELPEGCYARDKWS